MSGTNYRGVRNHAVRITITLTDTAGTAVSAADTRLRVMTPGGTETEITPLTAGTTGVVYADYVPTSEGLYRYRAWRASSPQIAVEGEFDVADSPFATDPT